MFIYDGRVLLVQNDGSDEDAVLPISKALQRIRENKNLYKSDDIMSCIEQRFVGTNKSQLLHRACLFLPISAALLLKQNPQIISYAVRAFCNRDSIDMKSCRAMKHFPPETRVYTQVTFTKCLYALLTYHNYKPNQRTGWNLPNEKHESFKAHDLGMKIACGLEICASKVQNEQSDSLDNSNAWQIFSNRLKQSGYFGDEIEGSKEYGQRLEQAKQYFRMLSENHSTYIDAIAQEIHTHLKNMGTLSDQYKSDILTEYDSTLNDNEDWLNISQDDFDNMMSERYGIKKTLRCNNTADDADGGDATNLGVNLNTFLNQRSEFDGVDFRPLYQPDAAAMAAETRTNNNTQTTGNSIDFNPDAFQAHLNDMLNFVIPDDNWDSHSDSMSDFDEEDIERKIDLTKKSMGSAFSAYMDQMDRELSTTTIGSSFKNKTTTDDANDNGGVVSGSGGDDEDFDDIESFEPVDIDVNALKNLAESYKAQYGNHGPTTSLLSSLGMRLDTEQNAQDMSQRPSTGETP